MFRLVQGEEDRLLCTAREGRGSGPACRFDGKVEDQHSSSLRVISRMGRDDRIGLPGRCQKKKEVRALALSLREKGGDSMRC